MTLGLLQCDHVVEPLRAVAGNYEDMFAHWLPVEWRVYDVTAGEYPATWDECDGYVTTGSRRSVYEAEGWIQKLAAAIQDAYRAQIPVLGVCFGHQMIAQALGGEVTRCERGWGVGVHEFTVHQPAAWMEPPLSSFRVLMSCQDQVTALPPGAAVLAGNAHCPVGLFTVGSLLGIQGHPEFTPEYADAVLQHRRERLGAELVEAARLTLTQAPHGRELAQWVLQFFAAHSR